MLACCYEYIFSHWLPHQAYFFVCGDVRSLVLREYCLLWLWFLRGSNLILYVSLISLVLLCFVELILGNCRGPGVSSTVSHGARTHDWKSPTFLLAPSLLQHPEWPDSHPSPWPCRCLHRSPPLSLWTELQTLWWQPGAWYRVSHHQINYVMHIDRILGLDVIIVLETLQVRVACC